MDLITLILVGISVVIGVSNMAALDNLNTNLAQLKTDFEAFAASKQGGATEVQVQAAADSVAALDAEVKSAQ